MTDIKTLNGSTKVVDAGAIEALDEALRGGVSHENSAGYDAARTIWNAMVDRKPGLVAHAKGASDVQKIVNFAQDNNLMMSIRSGGHQIAGHAVVDGALLLDLSAMTSFSVDAAGKTRQTTRRHDHGENRRRSPVCRRAYQSHYRVWTRQHRQRSILS